MNDKDIGILGFAVNALEHTMGKEEGLEIISIVKEYWKDIPISHRERIYNNLPWDKLDYDPEMGANPWYAEWDDFRNWVKDNKEPKNEQTGFEASLDSVTEREEVYRHLADF